MSPYPTCSCGHVWAVHAGGSEKCIWCSCASYAAIRLSDGAS